ncbi:MAG TPA: hypothetical protein VGN96_04015 [Roseococcus sp.]|jgi:hypothetical protein|nr:hypothetical protein [Roseococcus sp.]
MASRDLASNLAIRESIRPAVHSASTVTGEVVDTRGFDSAMVAVAVGAVASSGNVTLKLQHSDTTTGGDFTDVTAADLVGAFPAALVQNSVLEVGYIGPRRYLRVFGTLNSGTSVAYSAAVVLGHPNQAPAA